MPETAGRDDDFLVCSEVLQQNEKALYLATLLAPPESVNDLVVLRAYHAELAKIVRSTTEPLAGEIRLRWWADVFSGLRETEGRSHPVARALKTMLHRNDLSPQPLFAKAEAHIAELYSDPFDTVGTLEGHLGETVSTQFHMAAEIAGANANRALADACGHAGVAVGLTELLLNLAFFRARARCSLPESVLHHHTMTREEFFLQPDERHQAVVHYMEKEARAHWAKAQDHILALDSAVHSVFKSLALVPVQLKRIGAQPEAVLTSGLSPLSQLRIQWILWRG